MPHPMASERYVALTTFRRDGTPVATPVWIAPLGEELVVITLDETWKVRRLQRDPRVEVRPCDVRGRVAPDAATYAGTGRVLRDPAEVDGVRRAMDAKYLLARIGNLSERVLGGLMRRKPRVGIALRLEESPAAS
ncbi:PPOX class F420-dependent oxidoreductase [Alteromonas gracilis]